MAASDATPIPIKNQAYRVTFPILDADGDLVTAAGSLDSEVSKDGGTFADCTNEATEIATSSGVYYLDLTATEMNADTVAIIVKSTSGKTTTIVLYPQTDGLDRDVNVTHWNGTAVATPDTAGHPKVTIKDGTGAGEIALTSGNIDTVTAVTTVNGLAADTVNASALATDAVDELVDATWDEVLTGASHNVANSAGRRLRALQESGATYGGFVWIDTVNGTAGTTSYENGTSDNPVDSIADANTLAAALGISRFKVAPGSTITLAATQSNEIFEGSEWTLNLGSQNIAGSLFMGAVVAGTGTGSDANFIDCEIGTVTLDDCRMGGCRFSGTITLASAADYYFHDCYSGVAGSGSPTIDFGAAVLNTNLSMRRYSGGITINNKDNSGTDQMSLEGNGALTVAASSGGAISVRGNFKVTNTGGATITYDDNTQNAADILTDTAQIGTAGAGLTDLGGMSTGMKAEVNAEVDDVINTDTKAEPSAVIAANASLGDKINWLAALSRNKITQTATTQTLRNDADSADIAAATVSDSAGTFTRGEFA